MGRRDRSEAGLVTANQPDLIDDCTSGLDGNLSLAARESLFNCSDNHAPGCPCRVGGDVVLREVVIEDHGGYVVVAEVAP